MPLSWSSFSSAAASSSRSIENIDRQADGGTHVRNLRKVGQIEFLKAENKGHNNRRVYFRLTD